jgi:predicted alpha-1,2-mannosidase
MPPRVSPTSVAGAAVLAASLLFASCGGSSSKTLGRDPPSVSSSPGTTGAVPSVNVFIGTQVSHQPNPAPNGEAGNTYPAAALPFGMVQWGPDTPNTTPAGYDYDEDQILGFSLTHLSGAGCSAMRDFPVSAVVGAWSPTSLSASFAHSAEIASPGFYEVTLGTGIKVDLTATQRTGFARFTFPRGAPGTLVISGATEEDTLYVSAAKLQLGAGDVITGQRSDRFFCLTGESYDVYFAARFDTPFASSGAFDQGTVHAGATLGSGSDSGVYVTFDTSRDAAVQMKVGISYVSAANALANLDAESPAWDFDAIHAAAIARWNAALGRVSVEGGSKDDRTSFYTALYHVLLQPAVASDDNGQFMGLDGKVSKADGYVRYQNYSGWDVYRSWVQLVSVVAPDEASDILRSLVEAGNECGAMPRWALASTDTGVMVGDPSAAIIAGGYAFGATGFDANGALSQMIRAGTDPTAACNGVLARPGLADYLSLHYCPLDGMGAPQGTASTTVEYALDDFEVSVFAGALGDSADASAFLARAGYWKNVFDPSLSADGFTGFLQPRYAADESGAPDFEPVDVGSSCTGLTGDDGFVEGNATQYTLAIQHDVPGLISALGGDGALVARLDAYFTQLNAGPDLPYFYMGDEPGFSTPWAYDFAGEPYKTQGVVRRILQETFSAGPGGLPGNDDLGAMSAWQAWAMLGLYPAVPGVGGVVLGSPTFSKATISLGNDGALVIVGNGAARDAPYVQGLIVNGEASTSTWVPWARVAKGGTIAFDLGSTPVVAWGSAPGDRPPNFMQ